MTKVIDFYKNLNHYIRNSSSKSALRKLRRRGLKFAQKQESDEKSRALREYRNSARLIEQQERRLKN